MKILGVVLVAGGISAMGAEIGDGSFESVVIGSSYQPFYAGEAIGPWIVERGSVEIVRDYWVAAEGHQSIDMSGVWDWAGTMFQDISTEPGATYVIRFAFAGNPEDGDANKEMKVFWNDRELAHLVVNTKGRSFTDMRWKYYSFAVTADAPVARLKFQSVTYNFLGPVIDDVSIVPYTPSALVLQLFPGVTVTGAAHSVYRVEFTLDPIAAEWQTLAEVTIGADGKAIVLDPEAAQSQTRFYRSLLVSAGP
jgi:choice-of-anchor C domain-containing protein